MPTLYSRAYLQPDTLFPDSARLRVRLLALASSENWLSLELAEAIRHKLGVEIPGERGYSADFSYWLKYCEIRDLLDFVTIVICIQDKRQRPNIIAYINRIFAEESVAYEISDDGSVRPKVDLEFAATMRSALAGMDKARYRGVRTQFELGQAALTPLAPNWSLATYQTFRANEQLFKLVSSQDRLVADKVHQVYGPLIQAAYTDAPQILNEAKKILGGYMSWINAAHFERHAPESEEPHEMPQSLGALMVSQGASYLRWLLDLDARAQEQPDA